MHTIQLDRIFSIILIECIRITFKYIFKVVLILVCYRPWDVHYNSCHRSHPFMTNQAFWSTQYVQYGNLGTCISIQILVDIYQFSCLVTLSPIEIEVNYILICVSYFKFGRGILKH